MVTKIAEMADYQVPGKVGYQQEVVVKAAPKLITAVTAQELGAEISGPQAEVPQSVLEQVQMETDNYKAYLVERTEHYLAQMATKQGPTPQIGEVTEPSGYVFWDLLTVSPFQFINFPFTFLPHKLVAAGELVRLRSILFINPGPSGSGISATTVLGGRNFRVRFEHLDVTNIANGPDFTFVGIFPAIAPVFTIFDVFVIFPNPGLNPRILELTVTADITNFGQPFAAMQTNHFDLDVDPAFLFVPPQLPQFRNQTPLRYMVYPKF